MVPPEQKLGLSQIRTELQQIIIEVIGDDLRVVPDDIPILDLGVSSMALVEGMRRVYDRFGVLVSIRRVIEGQVTLGGLALYIEQASDAQQTQSKRARDVPRKWNVQREIPLAPSQQHIGFLSRYSSEAGAAFNEALVVRLEGALDGPALQAAIEAVGNKYEALRTALSPESNTLLVGSGEALELVGTPAASTQLEGRLAEIVSNPFETGKRLFRAELLRISEGEHVLALVGHALLFEQQALVIILNDIAELYRVFSQDLEAVAGALTLQWTDYLAMGETMEAKAAQQAAASYWQDVFASGVPRLELPADHPRPPVKKYAGARLALPLEPDLEARLRNSAAAEGLSPQVPLLAAFTAFLHRLSGTLDLVVGVESEPLYLETGMQAVARTRNLLPVRSAFDPLRSFRDHMLSQAGVLATSQTYKHLSLAELIQLLDLPRDQSRSALFSAAFRSWTQGEAPAFEGLKSTYLLPPSAGARYDLELIAVTMEGASWLVCDYSTELFAADTISRWLHGMRAFLQTGLEDPGQACGLLPMMTSAEREMLLIDWNRTEKSFPRERTVLDLIIEQAQARLNGTAIRFGESSLSYGQLLERVETIAAALHGRGVRKGDRVGILLKRGLDLIPAMLATWRLGALYVPMDTGFPKKRLDFMLEDASVQAVITNRELLSLITGKQDTTSLCLEDLGEIPGSAAGLIPPARGSDSAILFFTSGSTGKPKGVEIRHRALLNSLLALSERLEFTPQSTMMALTTISFDVSTNELFMPLIAGGCVDLGEDGLVADGLQLAERFESRKPSHVQATASTWKAVLTAGWRGNRDICLSSCGEALSRDLAEGLLEKCRLLWNWYGPTETTVYSAAYQVVSAPGTPMRIGRPFPNTQLYILDPQLQPVPIGAVGDLYISGEGLAVGYWLMPELTQERFIANPFLPGERMYRTGDLARYLPDGEIVCLGRVDDQVKIHGVRVELGEVEAALRGVPGVRDAVVVSRQDIHGDRQLVGHLMIASDHGSLTAAEVRARLRERLPEVMIPPYLLFSEAFPLTANGKVHRAALPAPDAVNQNPARAALEAPATPTEQMLAKAWADVLGIEVRLVGRDSDFMDLGGHSLLMTVLMLEVRRLFRVSFNLREFFGASTLRQFATLIDERHREQAGRAEAARGSRSKRSSEWARQRMAFLQREAQLPLHIAPERGLTFQPPSELKSVFLTGATGFLGAYIVSEILKTTRANLFCLVRPKRNENGKERIERQMRHYEVWGEDEAWQSTWDSRVHVVEGDVTLPRMGMTDSDYETLAREVDAIFHGAAHVNFIYPYEALRATNLLGIHEIIRFAFHSRMKPVHHLSTAAIWPMGAQYSYFEKDPIDHNGILNLGYDEAKWVGEKCLLHAAERGLPVARYRPGEVGGDSLTGHCVTDHFIVACLKGFLQFGALPRLDIEVDVAPVDYVAKAMVYLATRRDPLGRAFHLTNPTRRRMSDALVYLRSLGYQFEELPFEELRDRLVGSRDFASNALFAYQAALDDMDNVSMQLPTYDTHETQRELEGSGIACPPADEKLFGTYLRYLQGIGFIPQPERFAAHIESVRVSKERV